MTIKNSGGVDGAKTNLGAVGHGPIGKSKHKTKKGGRNKTSAGAQQASAVSVSSGKSPLFRFFKNSSSFASEWFPSTYFTKKVYSIKLAGFDISTVT